MIYNFGLGMFDAAKGTVEGIWSMIAHPIDTIKNLGEAAYQLTLMASMQGTSVEVVVLKQIIAAVSEMISDFDNGTLNKKARMIGRLVGEILLCVIGDKGVKYAIEGIQTVAKNSKFINALVQSEGKTALRMVEGAAEAKTLTLIGSKVTKIEKAILPDWVSKSFTNGFYSTVVTNEKVTLYRTFGGRADAGGGFATTLQTASRIDAKIDMALLPEWGNTRMYEAVIEVPKGQILNVGKVAEQYTQTGTKLSGGSDQILLPENWPLEWIKEVRTVPSK